MTAPTAAVPDRHRIEDMALEDLRFDPENPRLPPSVDGADDQAVLAWMLNDESVLELMGSIASQGYFPGEPVLVAPAAAGAGVPPYTVVEGNRRLAALLLLREPERAPVRKLAVQALVDEGGHRPDVMQAIVFPDRDDILDYLGYRHVTGIREWDPLAKARYVQQLRERAQRRGQRLTNQQLARKIGSRSDYVGRLLTGLQIYDHVAANGFYGLDGVNEDAISFAVLTTALSYERIAEFVGMDAGDPSTINDDNLRDLIDWMFRPREPGRNGGAGRTVLGESRNLGELAAVVKVPDARRALKEGERLSDAALLTDEPIRAFLRAIRQAIDKLRIAQSLTHRITHMSDDDQALVANLLSRSRALRNFVLTLGEEQDDDR